MLSQVGSTIEFKPDPSKEAKFFPYLATRHGGIEATREWKKSNTVQYYKELWYYSESFYIRRDYLSEGVFLNDEMIDVSRFENNRKENEEAVVVFPGYKDVMILIPSNQLKYKP
jgi:hypothetical protein